MSAFIARQPRPVPCACERVCGDVPEDEDGGTVCKGLPCPPIRPLVVVVMVPR